MANSPLYYSLIKTNTMNTETNYQIEIIHDEFAENPRKAFDHLGTMVCFHRKYTLGDSGHDYHSSEFDSWKELEKRIIEDYNPAVILPLYLYDHSGITISTGGFSCPWDSGQVGFIFISKATARREYGVKRISKKLRERLETYLNNEVKEYDYYLTGSCYGYEITKDGETVDSCWGYYGRESVREAAEESLKTFTETKVISLK